MLDNHILGHLEGAFGLEGVVGTIGEGHSSLIVFLIGDTDNDGIPFQFAFLRADDAIVRPAHPSRNLLYIPNFAFYHERNVILGLCLK